VSIARDALVHVTALKPGFTMGWQRSSASNRQETIGGSASLPYVRFAPLRGA